jgi:hypothetical protein
VLSYVGRGLRNELFTRPKEFYHVSSETRETLKKMPCPDPGWSAIGKNDSVYCYNGFRVLILRDFKTRGITFMTICAHYFRFSVVLDGQFAISLCYNEM